MEVAIATTMALEEMVCDQMLRLSFNSVTRVLF